MPLTVSNLQRISAGNKFNIIGDIAFDTSYPTGGESLSASLIGLSAIESFEIKSSESGYLFEQSVATGGATVSILVYSGGSASGTSGAGASHNHVFTGTAPIGSLDLTNTAFAGTGLTASAQTMTTTDNQTMTLNQCAGMWLIPDVDATPAMLILSNTAVTAAPAVFTVQGAAASDAGAYTVVRNIAPVGTNAAEATHTHAISAATGSEVANATDLSALTSVQFEAVGT